MVHGPRAKSKRSASVQVNYLVNIQEIRPWPPSQSLKTLRSALIQWENGERSSGTTRAVIPQLGPIAGEGKIEFNESFKLNVVLSREIGKAGDPDNFQKNLLEFNLYEPRRDKTVKGQLLGTAIINLADYGVIRDTLSLNAPVNCTRSFKNTAQPILNFEIKPLRKSRKNVSSDNILSREMSMDRNDIESVSSMTKEECNPEIASFTDDDISSHTSTTVTSSLGDPTPENDESSYESLKDGKAVTHHRSNIPSDSRFEKLETVTFETKDEETVRRDFTNGSSVKEQDLLGAAFGNGVALETDALSDEKLRTVSRACNSEQKEYLRAVQSQSDLKTINGSVGNKEKKNILSNGHKYSVQLKERNTYSDPRINKLEERVIMLEGELREAAAAEVSLYSIIAEHGSSMSKLHAPARRLSRLYMHTSKNGSKTRIARAARSAASGLVLVAKACGNDVPRLTFWLSNCVLLRAIISQANVDPKVPLSTGNISGKKTPSLSRWTESSNKINENSNAPFGSSEDWVDSHAFTYALEKIEGWIFSRVIESIWWQTLTPHMQSAAAKELDCSKSEKSLNRVPSSQGRDQGNFSLILWKKAFKDACERLCPVRAAGHECGCLPMLAKLVMEQCVARLDVAMFNALLRESGDDIPTDPVSDPISDLRVLPIQSGNFCFGAAVQLKNVIGNWSRVFSEVFGIDEDDSIVDNGDRISLDDSRDMSFRSFSLLNALSDLLMLPKDMLINKSTRKEICPAFGAQLIRRILDTYVPDEFCPDPVPKKVFQALEADGEEDIPEVGEVCFTDFPCTASSPLYLPPSAASLSNYIGEIRKWQLTRTTSSVLRKSYTSDDELDEIGSPMNSICLDGVHSPSVHKSNHKKIAAESAVRYQLLREVWEDSV
uniref:C2 NT-type domain-containing protein n=1 Tax=Kalanchoe fedtschenkoi TaxID=63787 RepID=A0A7N0T7P3_KALFE